MASEAESAARSVATVLVTDPRFGAATRVALYAAFRGELPTLPVFGALRSSGRTCLFPRIRGRDLEWAVVEAWESLVVGSYGIPAPPDTCAAVCLTPSDAVLLPGLAFDRCGGRVGHGGGYFDRAFPPGTEAPDLIGVGYAFQVVERVPCGSRDRRVDAIVTERGLRWCAPVSSQEAMGAE